jgi:hypothetical protein
VDKRGQRAIADQIAYYRARASEYDEEFHGADLQAALEGIGWEARIEPVAGGFFWGEAQAADR